LEKGLKMSGMSSSRSMIVRAIRRRLGAALVLAVSALATGLATGNSLAAAIVAVVAVFIFGGVMASREKPQRTRTTKRKLGKPYSTSYRWKVSREPNLKQILKALNQEGQSLSVDRESTHELALLGGSQLWTRLFGGYFVDPRRLPVHVELATRPISDSGRSVVELGVRDRLRVAVRDEALEDRFELAVQKIRNTVQAQLELVGDIEADSRGSSQPR
jgi:hypothetical protein